MESKTEKISDSESFEVRFREAVLYVVKEVYGYIFDETGLSLTQIEAVGLNHIAKEVLENDFSAGIIDMTKLHDHLIRCKYDQLITERFFWEFYDLRIIDLSDMLKKHGKEKVSQFMKSKQAALHRP
jgi:hypothetical protein